MTWYVITHWMDGQVYLSTTIWVSYVKISYEAREND